MPLPVHDQLTEWTPHVAVELFRWQHRPPLVNLPLLKRIRRGPYPNFGDEIGPMVVRAILDERGLPAADQTSNDGRLVSVGSVFHLAQAGDHVWGTGVNAKRTDELVNPADVTIHAVRGPKTYERLTQLGYKVPNVFGDPALLIKKIPEIGALDATNKSRKLAFIPNFNDMKKYRRHPDLISPLQDPVSIAREIARSEFVVGSSLHAMVFADALGVPSRLMISEAEPRFKYDDYYLGSGRDRQEMASSIEEAMKMGSSDIAEYDPRGLLDAFPGELFMK